MAKTKYHVFRLKIMRAPPGAPPLEIKILDNGQGRARAYFYLMAGLDGFLNSYADTPAGLAPFGHVPPQEFFKEMSKDEQRKKWSKKK